MLVVGYKKSEFVSDKGELVKGYFVYLARPPKENEVGLIPFSYMKDGKKKDSIFMTESKFNKLNIPSLYENHINVDFGVGLSVRE